MYIKFPYYPTNDQDQRIGKMIREPYPWDRDTDRKRLMPEDLFEKMSKNMTEGTLKTDIYTEDSTYIIKVQVPGYSRDDIELSLDGNRLKLRVTKSEKNTKSGKDYYEESITKGRQSKDFVFPEDLNLDTSAMKAELGKGILQIKVPFEEDQSREIDIH